MKEVYVYLSLQQQTRLNSICPYFTRFPLAFPLAYLCEAAAGQWVLDPFCGAGASVFAARLLGLGAVGVDNSRVAAAIARAKLRHVTPAAVIDKAAHILHYSSSAPVPEGPFWDNCYTPAVLEALCRFRAYFAGRKKNTAVDWALSALLLGLLHGPNTDGTPRFFSNHLTADFAPNPQEALRFWTEHRLAPPQCDMLRMIAQRAVHLFAVQPPSAMGVVREGDSRNTAFAYRNSTFDWVITSPPYYGMNSYGADQWLRHWFLGGAPCPARDTTAQISQQNPKAYIHDLATVWKRLAPFCTPGAKLIVRIGNVPGSTAPPALELFQASLTRAASGWKIENSMSVQRDTTTQKSHPLFSAPAPWPENEMEVVARLNP
jgi:DNA modification methylase